MNKETKPSYKNFETKDLLGNNFNLKESVCFSTIDYTKKSPFQLIKEMQDSIPKPKDSYDTLQEFFADVIKFRIKVTVKCTEMCPAWIIKDKIVICRENPYSMSQDRIVYCNEDQLGFFKKIKDDGILGTQLIISE